MLMHSLKPATVSSMNSKVLLLCDPDPCLSYQDPTSYAYQFQDDPYLSPQNSAEFVRPTKYILLIVCIYLFILKSIC